MKILMAFMLASITLAACSNPPQQQGGNPPPATQNCELPGGEKTNVPGCPK